MAIRKNRLARAVIGIGRRRSSIQRAIRCQAIDVGTKDLKSGASDADLIIIATPV